MATTRVKNAIIPVYLSDQTKAAAVIRVGRIYPDFQRRGFFRIGLLPLGVAEEVQFDALDPQQLPEAVQGIAGALNPTRNACPFELRKASFVLSKEPVLRLDARRVCFQQNGCWQLTDGVVVQTSTNQVRLSRALLQVSGPRAGRLSWVADNEPREVVLFNQYSPPANPKQSTEKK